MGQAAVQSRSKQCLESGVRLFQQGRRPGEKGQIIRFRAEGQMGAAQGAENAHAAQREIFRLAHRKGVRQLHHHIRAAAQRHFSPGMGGQQRGQAALGEAAADHADHCVRFRPRPGLRQMIGMALMEGIVFRNDPANPHALAPFFIIISEMPGNCKRKNDFTRGPPSAVFAKWFLGGG